MVTFWATMVKILILLNPFAVLSTFLSLTGNVPPSQTRRICLQSGVAIILSGIALYFCGQGIFTLLGINLDVFRVGGGVILLACSLNLVWGNSSSQNSSVKEPPSGNIAVVPIAIPMAVGPGTAAGLIIIGMERTAITHVFSSISALIVSTIALITLLWFGTYAERYLKREGILIVTKLSGLFLSAIASKMILEGARQFLLLNN